MSYKSLDIITMLFKNQFRYYGNTSTGLVTAEVIFSCSHKRKYEIVF